MQAQHDPAPILHHFQNQKIVKSLWERFQMPTKAKLVAELKKNANPDKAAFFPHFFKTGPGEYGEGDKFLGVTVPHQRKIAKSFRDLSPAEITKLLDDKFHECRLTALLIMVEQYRRGDESQQQLVVDLYLKKIDRINNWDLVDSSAHQILGPYLQDRNRALLTRLANSRHLWSERIAMMTTYHFIQQGDFVDALRLAKKFLKHKHDLIHKVVGWMLREIGKQDRKTLTTFLDEHAAGMPRTMLRYSIEKLPEKKRQQYLKLGK
jgi:3-methyladenine DNA glycosylase AlkD